MVPRPLTAALVVCCVIALALNVVFDGPPGAAMVLAGVVGAALALTRSPDPTPALQPAGRHHLDKPPTFTEHELAAFAALTDDDRAELDRLGADLTGLPTPDATPAPRMSRGEYVLPITYVTEFGPDAQVVDLPADAAAAWHREAGARPDWFDMIDDDGRGLSICLRCRWAVPAHARRGHDLHCPRRTRTRSGE